MLTAVKDVARRLVQARFVHNPIRVALFLHSHISRHQTNTRINRRKLAILLDSIGVLQRLISNGLDSKILRPRGMQVGAEQINIHPALEEAIQAA